jgi:hypothetical protein
MFRIRYDRQDSTKFYFNQQTAVCDHALERYIGGWEKFIATAKAGT